MRRGRTMRWRRKRRNVPDDYVGPRNEWPHSCDSTPLFSLGQIVATPGALALCEQAGVRPGEYLGRHVVGDWGLVDPEDGEANEEAVVTGARVFSA